MFQKRSIPGTRVSAMKWKFITTKTLIVIRLLGGAHLIRNRCRITEFNYVLQGNYLKNNSDRFCGPKCLWMNCVMESWRSRGMILIYQQKNLFVLYTESIVIYESLWLGLSKGCSYRQVYLLRLKKKIYLGCGSSAWKQNAPWEFYYTMEFSLILASRFADIFHE